MVGPVGRSAISVGGVLSQTLATVGRHWLPYFSLSLLLAALDLTILAKPHLAPEAFAPFNVVVTALRMVVAIILQAGMTYATARSLDGEPFATLRGIDAGLRCFLPYAAVTILYVLAIAAGIVMLLVPGLIAFAVLGIAPAVIVIENAGPIAALGRSRVLTKGSRWRVLAVQAIGFIAPMVVVGTVDAALSTASNVWPEQNLWQQLCAAAADLLLSPVYFALAPVLYHHLRHAEEVADPAHLTEIFA